MPNRIKQILQKCEEALPGSSASCASKQSEISTDECAPRFCHDLRDKQRKSLDPFRCDRVFIQSCDMRTLKVLVMLAENSHDNENWKTHRLVNSAP